MTQRNHFNACPSCNRLMAWHTDKQKCPNCGHEEPLEYRREREKAKDDPILDALRQLQNAVNEISGHWTESIDNAMQNADLAIANRNRSLMALGLADIDGETRTVAELIENAGLVIDVALDELTTANAQTKSGLASLLLLALVGQVSCIKARILAILNAVREERKADGQPN
jgi:predicted RNA-binding Zn-ribbon protein involved in translation (DUF1610 family)